MSHKSPFEEIERIEREERRVKSEEDERLAERYFIKKLLEALLQYRDVPFSDMRELGFSLPDTSLLKKALSLKAEPGFEAVKDLWFEAKVSDKDSDYDVIVSLDQFSLNAPQEKMTSCTCRKEQPCEHVVAAVFQVFKNAGFEMNEEQAEAVLFGLSLGSFTVGLKKKQRTKG